MRRRDFLTTAANAFLGLGLAGCAGLARRPQQDFKAWTWVHGGRERSPEQWRERFGRLRNAGVGAVLVSGGDIGMLSAAARGEGLEFHRWIWTLNRNGDKTVQAEHPEWFTVSRNGESSLEKPPYVGYYKWLCPTRPEVRRYLSGVVDELAQDDAVDGVHLDYVRHCDVILPVALWEKYGLVQNEELAEFDFCYCDVCRETFRLETGEDPLALEEPTRHVAWREFRWRNVSETVGELASAVHARGKPITAAVFPTPTIARKLVRQAWETWPLDAFFPMLYNSFYEEGIDWIGTSVGEGVAALPASTPLYAGLFLPDLPPEDLARAITVARDAGASGVSFFEMDGLTDEHLGVVRGSFYAGKRTRA